MKKIFLIAGFITGSLLCMEQSRRMQDLNTDILEKDRTEFKKKFFPDLATSTLDELLDACSFYYTIPDNIPIMGNISFGKVRSYADMHDSVFTNMFMRYANSLMTHAYSFALSSEEQELFVRRAITTIEENKSLMSYICTGDKSKLYTQQELQLRISQFRRVVETVAAAASKRRNINA